jgi:hypothetical protein
VQHAPVSYSSYRFPHQPGIQFSLDSIEGLPRSGSVDCIMAVVDKFSKFRHFILDSHPYTAATIAQLFLSNVYRLHGLPVVVVSDRDPIFTSKFWQHLFKLVGTKLKMSSSYHPQMDEQTEHGNQCLETFLHCFANGCSKKWSLWFPTRPRLDFGIIPIYSLHWAALPLRSFMVAIANPVPLAFPWMTQHLLSCQISYRSAPCLHHASTCSPAPA